MTLYCCYCGGGSSSSSSDAAEAGDSSWKALEPPTMDLTIDDTNYIKVAIAALAAVDRIPELADDIIEADQPSVAWAA
jgi:hypothetical protein